MYTGRTSSQNDDSLAVEDLGDPVIMAVHLLACKNIVTGYLRDPGLEIMTVAHHDCVKRLGHDRVPLQIPDLDRPLPIPYGRFHQFYMMQQLRHRTFITTYIKI